MIYKLDEIARFQKGFAFKSKDFVKCGTKIVKVSNLTNESIDSNSCVHIDNKLAKNYVQYELMEDDIIITTVGSWPTNPASVVGKVVKVPSNMKFSLLNQNSVRIRANDLVNQKYLYYLLKSNSFKEYIVGTAQGSANQASITQKDIKNFKYNIPNLNEQKAIAKVLSDLDEKIETNNKINKTLEEMAQAIFKQWFVDFEFPNEEGKPYKSSGGEMVESELGKIPKGWVVTSLNDIVDIFNGYSYKGKELSESKDAMITIKNFDRNGGYKVDGLKEILISDKVKPHHYVEINDIVVAHTDLTQGAEIIGNPILVHSKGKYDKLIMSMDTVKVKSKIKEINNELLYFILKDYRFKQYALGYVNGTTVLHLSKSTIPQYNIAVPTDKSLMIQLGNCLSSVMRKVSNNVKENEKLISIRDTLLPKLMSGEIRVPLSSIKIKN